MIALREDRANNAWKMCVGWWVNDTSIAVARMLLLFLTTTNYYTHGSSVVNINLKSSIFEYLNF